MAKGMGLCAVLKVRFVRGKARNRTWRKLERRPHDWASCSLQREFAVVIRVEVLAEEMYGVRRVKPAWGADERAVR